MANLIISQNVAARAQRDWYRFQQNAYYSDIASVYAVRVHETINGEFYVDVTYSDAHKGTHSHYVGYRSNGFATLAEAYADANRVWLYVRDQFVSDYGCHAIATRAMDAETPIRYSTQARGSHTQGDFITGSNTPPMADGSKAYETRQTFCPVCEHFGTLSTRGFPVEVTYCATPGCKHSASYDHGD